MSSSSSQEPIVLWVHRDWRCEFRPGCELTLYLKAEIYSKEQCTTELAGRSRANVWLAAVQALDAHQR